MRPPARKVNDVSFAIRIFRLHGGELCGTVGPMGALKSIRCKKGHLLKGQNLYVRRNGTRECRRCSIERSQQWRKQRREMPK